MGVVELSTNSEVGALRVVILHRPGAELLRLNPRNVDELLFDGLPWVARAQDETDAYPEVIAGVERELGWRDGVVWLPDGDDVGPPDGPLPRGFQPASVSFATKGASTPAAPI